MLHRMSGVTLIELLVTLVVLAILLGLGVPSFTNIIQNNRSTALANDMVTALNLARNEAVRRGACINICSSNNGTSCSGTWTDGWIVRVEDGDLIRVWGAPRSGAVIAQTSGTANKINFGPLGDLRGGTQCATEVTGSTNFQTRFTGCKGEQARRINVGASGRIITSRLACP